MYKSSCDDPYKVLAFNIVVSYPVPIIKRMMVDTKFLRREITREIRGQDFKGIFIDCLFVTICEEKKRMELMHQLDALALFLYRQLDLNRMREEIKNAFNRLGLGELLEEPTSSVIIKI